MDAVAPLRVQRASSSTDVVAHAEWAAKKWVWVALDDQMRVIAPKNQNMQASNHAYAAGVVLNEGNDETASNDTVTVQLVDSPVLLTHSLAYRAP